MCNKLLHHIPTPEQIETDVETCYSSSATLTRSEMETFTELAWGVWPQLKIERTSALPQSWTSNISFKRIKYSSGLFFPRVEAHAWMRLRFQRSSPRISISYCDMCGQRSFQRPGALANGTAIWHCRWFEVLLRIEDSTRLAENNKISINHSQPEHIGDTALLLWRNRNFRRRAGPHISLDS